MTESGNRIFNIVLALLISVAAWTYVVYNFYPMTDVKYRDIPIEFVGEDDLASRGYGIVESSRDSINVTLNQKRIETGKISADDITVTADVSDAIEGDNGISLTISGPDGTQVVETDARSVSVDVEKADSRTVDVVVAYSSSNELGTEPLVTDLSSETATIVGAGSEVGSVDKVVAYLDFSEVSENVRNFTRPLVAIDENGEIIPHMVIYPEEVKFNAKAGYTKTVDLVVNVTDNSDDGYERTYTAPETIVIKGEMSDITAVDRITTVEINISYIYEDTELDLSYALPDGVTIANESLGGKLAIKVAEKKEEKADTDKAGDTESEDTAGDADGGADN